MTTEPPPLILHHGTTLRRARAIEANGPDPSFREPGSSHLPPAEGFSTVVGDGRSPQALHDLVTKMATGQPGWLVHIDRWSEAVLLHDGTAVAVLFALFCVLVAVSVYLHPTVTQIVLVVAMVAIGFVWVTVQDFGGDLAPGATDPNSGLLVVLFILSYWPLTAASAANETTPAGMKRPVATREG